MAKVETKEYGKMLTNTVAKVRTQGFKGVVEEIRHHVTESRFSEEEKKQAKILFNHFKECHKDKGKNLDKLLYEVGELSDKDTSDSIKKHIKEAIGLAKLTDEEIKGLYDKKILEIARKFDETKKEGVNEAIAYEKMIPKIIVYDAQAAEITFKYFEDFGLFYSPLSPNDAAVFGNIMTHHSVVLHGKTLDVLTVFAEEGSPQYCGAVNPAFNRAYTFGRNINSVLSDITSIKSHKYDEKLIGIETEDKSKLQEFIRHNKLQDTVALILKEYRNTGQFPASTSLIMSYATIAKTFIDEKDKEVVDNKVVSSITHNSVIHEATHLFEEFSEAKPNATITGLIYRKYGIESIKYKEFTAQCSEIVYGKTPYYSLWRAIISGLSSNKSSEEDPHINAWKLIVTGLIEHAESNFPDIIKPGMKEGEKKLSLFLLGEEQLKAVAKDLLYDFYRGLGMTKIGDEKL